MREFAHVYLHSLLGGTQHSNIEKMGRPHCLIDGQHATAGVVILWLDHVKRATHNAHARMRMHARTIPHACTHNSAPVLLIVFVQMILRFMPHRLFLSVRFADKLVPLWVISKVSGYVSGPAQLAFDTSDGHV